MKRLKSKQLKAFSLIEMVVAISIFSVVMTAVVAVFISMVKTQRTSKNMQTNLEDARGALEAMAKNIRMSTVDNASASEINIYNYSQNKCINYSFSSSTKKINTREAVILQRAQVLNCKNASYSSAAELISSGIENFRFEVDQSTDLKAGKAIIWLKMEATADPFQTTISLRDYKD